MAVSATSPLLGDFVNGAVDYRGHPATRSKTGRWSSSIFIIGVEIAEKIAYHGVSSNLITFLTGPMNQSTATAAEIINIWTGAISVLPLLGAFVADSYLGRYRTIFAGSVLHLLGLTLLTLSVLLPSLHPHGSIKDGETTVTCSAPSQLQVFFFFFSLYLVALGEGAYKPCAQAFGADQFDEHDPKEKKSKSSFFNWWYFGLCGGATISVSVLSYIQDNLGWVLGFGIPCASMAFALTIFLLGAKNYRYSLPTSEDPFSRIHQFFCSNVKVAGVSNISDCCSPQNDCPHNSVKQKEEKNRILLLSPIWATCLMYAVVCAQYSTFFTKQGSTMNRKIGSNFEIPSAALQSVISFTVLLMIPVYDRILVPTTRIFTGISNGITMLQRIGTGMFLSVIAMAVAALVEMKRLGIARDFGLVDFPTETVPMSIWWLVPQFLLFGVADVFTMVGLQEFFYDQMPDGLKSLGIALYLSIFGAGNFLSGFIISLTEAITGGHWFSDNLNRAHLDYFYWLLCGLSIVELAIYLFFAKSYVYKKNSK